MSGKATKSNHRNGPMEKKKQREYANFVFEYHSY